MRRDVPWQCSVLSIRPVLQIRSIPHCWFIPASSVQPCAGEFFQVAAISSQPVLKNRVLIFAYHDLYILRFLRAAGNDGVGYPVCTS